ncbi:MAG: hypothetical protein KC478_07360 [Bacteriovoracaceae bacterium]|nr:hypothetical protein [Bacteriovoracaceae bacterium]
MKAILLLLISFSAFSQVTEIDVIDQLSIREREVIESIVEVELKQRRTIPREAITIQVADILASPTHKVHVRRGSSLVNLASGRQELLTKDIYAIAHTMPDASGYYFLQNQDGQSRYKTLSSNITNISEVTQMYEPPHKYEEVAVVKKDINYTDEQLDFSTEFNFHLGLTRPVFTKDLVNEESHFGQSLRYEAQVYDDFSLPFSIGANLMLENTRATLNSSGESYSVSTMSIGPLVKLQAFELFDTQVIPSIGVRTSIFSRFTETRKAETLNYSLAQTSLFFGLQHNYKVSYGEIAFGANFQRQWVKASSDTFNTDLSFDSNYDDSFGISIGHIARWP